MSDVVPARAPFRWYGGKWRIAPQIVAHFPTHESYVEPFGGSAAVLLQKPPSLVETFNDLDGTVVNFFKVLRERTEEFVTALSLTPYSRAELELSFTESDDEFEAARRFFVRTCQSRDRTSKLQRNGGWRYLTHRHGAGLASLFADNDHLLDVVERLRVVQFECADAADVISRFDTPTTLFYVDPPYVHSTRGRSNTGAYRHEMTDQDHCALADLLHNVRGMVALSGYESGLYQELYGDWRAVIIETYADDGKSRLEHLWLSPSCVAAQPELLTWRQS